jgi:signal transduction histidine kinase
MAASLDTEELNALIQVSKTVNAHLDLDAVLESVMSVTTEVMQVEASCLVLVDDETGDLLFHVAQGAKAEAVKPIRMKPGEGIVGWVVESGKPAIVNDVATDPRFYGKVDEDSGFVTKAILCVPLATKDRLWGAIEVINKLDGGDFDQRDLELCEAVAAQAAVAIENAVLHADIVKTERLAAIGHTIAGLAHCIKNVLHGIQGGSYMVDLGLRKDDPKTLSRGWEIVRKNNVFMQELVLDMLTYSKERQPECVPADLNELIEGICDLMAQKAAQRGVTIVWTRNPDLSEVVLDPKGIRRCLLNLVSNAVDACDELDDGRVEVVTETPDNGTFRIKVSDSGCGISDEDKEKLFQVFFSTKGSKGTGLGLPVTHKIITEHAGQIAVDSGVGEGTTFTITLPLRNGTGLS